METSYFVFLYTTVNVRTLHSFIKQKVVLAVWQNSMHLPWSFGRKLTEMAEIIQCVEKGCAISFKSICKQIWCNSLFYVSI
jgi:hypothetical protein